MAQQSPDPRPVDGANLRPKLDLDHTTWFVQLDLDRATLPAELEHLLAQGPEDWPRPSSALLSQQLHELCGDGTSVAYDWPEEDEDDWYDHRDVEDMYEEERQGRYLGEFLRYAGHRAQREFSTAADDYDGRLYVQLDEDGELVNMAVYSALWEGLRMPMVYQREERFEAVDEYFERVGLCRPRGYDDALGLQDGRWMVEDEESEMYL